MSDPPELSFSFDVSAWPELAHVPGVFVTATAPGAGKTIVAGAIASHLRRAGRDVEVFLPAAGGCRHGRGGLISPDADFLAACAESRLTLSEIAPVRTALSLEPSAAARAERRAVDPGVIFDAWARLAGRAEAAVVEAPGGLASPIAEGLWTIHLAIMLALPVVVVAQARPGEVSAALLTIHAARSAGLNVAGVVVNRYRADAAAEPNVDWAMATTPAQIARHGRVKVLALVPDDPANSVARAALAASARFAIDQAPWEEIVFGGA